MTRAIKTRGLVAAMEAASTEPVVVLEPIEMDKDHTHTMPTDAPVDNSANSPETMIMEMISVEDECTRREMLIGDGEIIIAKLEEIRDVLGVAAENGGVDRYSAAAVTVAVEHLFEQAGITKENSKHNMPAMEEYGGLNSRAGATTLAIEAININIAKIWDAIINALKKAWEWVKSFFTNVGTAAKGQLERAKAMMARKVSGQPKTATIENAELAKAINSGNSVRPDDILKAINTLTARATSVFTRSDQYMVANGERIIKAIEGAIGDNKVSLDFTIDADNENIPENEVLPGNVHFVFNAPKQQVTGPDAMAALDEMRGNGIHPAPEANNNHATSLQVLTPEGIQHATNGVERILEMVMKYLETLDVKNRLKAAGLSALEKAKRAQETAGDAANNSYEAIKKLAKAFVSVIDKAISAFCSYVVRICKRLLDYVAESINKYEMPTVGAEPKAELENNPTPAANFHSPAKPTELQAA